MRYLILGTLVIAIFTFAAREVAAQPRTCVRADLAEAFVLPDGSAHPAGTLRICLERDYSPVAGLHSIVADGDMSGTFLSRRMQPEAGTAAAPRLAFVRDAGGALLLRGYTMERSGKVEAYWLQSPHKRHAAAPESVAVQAPVWLAAVESR